MKTILCLCHRKAGTGIKNQITSRASINHECVTKQALSLESGKTVAEKWVFDYRCGHASYCRGVDEALEFQCEKILIAILPRVWFGVVTLVTRMTEISVERKC